MSGLSSKDCVRRLGISGLGVGPPSEVCSIPRNLMDRLVSLKFDVWRSEAAAVKTPKGIFKLAKLPRAALVQLHLTHTQPPSTKTYSQWPALNLTSASGHLSKP